MAKAKDAFRTISEVAEWLDTPTHVLRFWESKFTQIKPVKGAGGRRYYRPTDMDLLGGIKKLLHEDGLTIKGTQKLLREKGVKHVAGLGPSMTGDADLSPIEIAVKAKPQPAPVVPSQADLPLDGPPVEPKIKIDLPLPPAGLPNLPARLIGRAPIDPAALQDRAAQIAPLLARLENLRTRMQEA
ncbi:MerR family transcriptional regulator [Loktanella sp. Alg231-35]|uniref:MerR family transcriptional regulator n=1 Tax=Loktanella sp. Alg231-35 TaxID=1922220 RepID=UPI000D54CB7A|nr:MerR family transcriptional regulator [Loktanella sp. Alg231-35]